MIKNEKKKCERYKQNTIMEGFRSDQMRRCVKTGKGEGKFGQQESE